MNQYKILKSLIERKKDTKIVVDIGTALDPHYLIKLAKDHPAIGFYATDVDVGLLSKILGPKNLKKEHGDIMHLHYPSNFADVTSEFATMPLVSLQYGDVSGAVDHMNRITKKGGYVVFGNLMHHSLVISDNHLKQAKEFAKAKDLESIKKYFLKPTKEIFRFFGLRFLSEQISIGSAGAAFICQKVTRIKPPLKVSFIDESRFGAVAGIINKM